MSTENCRQCPNPENDGYERFRFLVAEFDVKLAREIITKSPREPLEVSYEQLRSLGLGLDPDGDWKVREDGTRYKTIHMGTYVNEDHLAHIPAEKMTEPGGTQWPDNRKSYESRIRNRNEAATLKRKIMRIEWSPSRESFIEVLQCGHAGQKRKSRIWPHRAIGDSIKLIKVRVCKECQA